MASGFGVNVELYNYIVSSSDNRERYARLINIRNQLEDTLLRGATSGEYDEYNLDDGQTKIKVIFRNNTEIINAIKAMDTLIGRVENRLIGRTFNLKDSKTIKNYNYRY